MLFWCSISSLKQCPLTGSQICKSEIQHGVTGFSAQGITRLQSSYLRPEFGNSKENPLPSSYFKLVEFSPSLFPFPGYLPSFHLHNNIGTWYPDSLNPSDLLFGHIYQISFSTLRGKKNLLLRAYVIIMAIPII